jgi:molybdopterin-guanine dinucleotide biosynthesis protein A
LLYKSRWKWKIGSLYLKAIGFPFFISDGGRMIRVETTGIILAGGQSSRMQKNKAFLKVGNLQIIERIQKELQEVCSELMVVTNTPEEYISLGITTVVDLIPHKGPLSGIHAGLLISKSIYNLVVACDMPFISQNLAKYMMEIAPGYDAVVPRFNGMSQPLFAVYSKSCIEPIEYYLNLERRSLTKFLPYIKVCWIEEACIRKIGNPDALFLNVNTPQDLEGAMEFIERNQDNLE